jgi:hypothetical protein
VQPSFAQRKRVPRVADAVDGADGHARSLNESGLALRGQWAAAGPTRRAVGERPAAVSNLAKLTANRCKHCAN